MSPKNPLAVSHPKFPTILFSRSSSFVLERLGERASECKHPSHSAMLRVLILQRVKGLSDQDPFVEKVIVCSVNIGSPQTF